MLKRRSYERATSHAVLQSCSQPSHICFEFTKYISIRCTCFHYGHIVRTPVSRHLLIWEAMPTFQVSFAYQCSEQIVRKRRCVVQVHGKGDDKLDCMKVLQNHRPRYRVQINEIVRDCTRTTPILAIRCDNSVDRQCGCYRRH